MTRAVTIAQFGAIAGDNPISGFRNAIINGNFDIWQRGTSFSSAPSGQYSADRWYISYDGTGATRTLSRQTFTLGQTDVQGNPTYFLRHDQSVAGSSGTYNTIEQRIENVRTFAGQTVTLSFYAKAASALTMPLVSLRQFFGTGGSPSSFVDTTLTSNISITTSWVKFDYTVTLPSISGKTLGSDNNDWLGILFFLPINTTFTFDIAQVQLEVGPVATPFERRPVGTELALCQRYYQKTFPLGIVPASIVGTTGAVFGASSATNVSFSVTRAFLVQMRAAPTMVFFSPNQAGSNWSEQSGYVPTLTDLGATDSSVSMRATGSISGGGAHSIHFTASAEL